MEQNIFKEMRKLFLNILKRSKNVPPEFAIEKKVMVNGTELLRPVVRFGLVGMFNDWIPIIKVEGEGYHALDLDLKKQFTEIECKEWIDGYRQQLEMERGTKIEKILYQVS